MVHGRHRAGLPPMAEPGEKETQQPLDHRDWFGFAKSRQGEKRQGQFGSILLKKTKMDLQN